MQQDEVADKADYDDLTLNPLMAEIEAGVSGEADAKNKQRRYWTAKEEQCFYEIWGRDNWRLTRHGKNTVFFAQWADEMKERHDIDIAPSEVQAKVNQTRAKFRAVKKHASFDKNGPRWKKFDIVDRILKNKYRPKDAEPIPPEVLLKNRDISPDPDENNDDAAISGQRATTPTSSITSNSQDTNITPQQHTQNVIISAEQHVDLNNSSLGEHDVSASLFNANELQPNPDYGSQLYNDVKQEFPTEYHHPTPYTTQYTNEQNHFTPSMIEEPPQLLELQTPQQQQQMQHHQQQQQQQQQPPPPPPPPPAAAPPQPQYNNIAGTNVAFEHHSAPTNSNYTPSSADAVNMFNNQPHYSTAPMASTGPQQSSYNNVPQQYGNNNYIASNNGGNTNNGTNNGIMQPPRPTTQAVAPRKRGRTPSNSNHALVAVSGATSSDPTLEIQYLDEVRKKNVILDEQKDIARKRLHLEERKVTLMEQFFPKFLEMQAKIVDRLQGWKQEQPSQ